MTDTYISFYLRSGRIHIYVDALRRIGKPKYIRFLIAENGERFALTAFPKKDFGSHRVPQGLYTGFDQMEVNSVRLCKIIADMYHWDSNFSYRVPGTIVSKENAVVFNLKKAEQIAHK